MALEGQINQHEGTRNNAMLKLDGFFPPEQLESRDPRGAEVLVLEVAARRREKENTNG